jgi:TatD DNase family protein
MLIDAHAHLDKYGAELPAALREIAENRIVTIATAMDIASYQELQRIAERSDLVLATFGVHPKRAPQYAHRLREINPLIEATPLIGEIGLDFHWVQDNSQYPAQRKVLNYFFSAAREQKKIVNLHTKGAEKEILQLLEHYDVQRAIVHWYSGPLDILRNLVQFGAYFTFGVELIFSENIRALAAAVPNRLLLTETDNPGGLKWLKDRVGMPSVIREVVETLAHVKQVSEREMGETIRSNLLRLIQDDPWLEDFRAMIEETRWRKSV